MIALILLTVLTLVVIPVLVNKTTEGHGDSLKRYLREAWFVVAVLYTAVILGSPDGRNFVMQHRPLFADTHPFWTYATVGAGTALLACAYWFLLGRLVPRVSSVARAPLTQSLVKWPDPSPIIYGNPLSTTQLNATSEVLGTFTYNYDVGDILPVGTHDLTVRFVPADGAKYSSAEKAVKLTVNPAPPQPVRTAKEPAPPNAGGMPTPDPDIALLKRAVDSAQTCIRFQRRAQHDYDDGKAKMRWHDKITPDPKQRAGFDQWELGIVSANTEKMYEEDYRDDLRTIRHLLVLKVPDAADTYANYDDPANIMGVEAICSDLSNLTAAYADQQCKAGKITGSEQWGYQSAAGAIYIPKCPAARAVMGLDKATGPIFLPRPAGPPQ